MRLVNFDDLESLVGTEVGVSPWHQITQSQINKFAEATGDHQWIHVDVERATRELGAPIAHGYLTLSLLPMLAAQIMRVENVQRGINFGCNKVRFTNMVPVGLARAPAPEMPERRSPRRRQADDDGIHHRDRGQGPPGLRGRVDRHHLRRLIRRRLLTPETCARTADKAFSPHDFIGWSLGRITSVQ